jgi:hypothetical protein
MRTPPTCGQSAWKLDRWLPAAHTNWPRGEVNIFATRLSEKSVAVKRDGPYADRVMECGNHRWCCASTSTPGNRSSARRRKDVTQPVYAKSVGRWQHYAKYLEPIIEKLQPFLGEFGYA